MDAIIKQQNFKMNIAEFSRKSEGANDVGKGMINKVRVLAPLFEHELTSFERFLLR